MRRSGTNRFRPGTLGFLGRVNLYCSLLALTLFLPVSREAVPGVDGDAAYYFWDLIGIIGFAPMLTVVFPGTIGVVGLLMGPLGRDRTLLAMVMFLLLVLGIGILDIDPTQSLVQFGLWEEAPGHRLMLFLGCGCCAVSGAICNGSRRGTAWGTAGAALIVAYLLTPTPAGMVPLAESIDGLFRDTVVLAYQEPALRLLADLGLFVGASMTLLALQERVAASNPVHRRAILAGWLVLGLLPALLFPLLIVYWKGAETFILGPVVVREYLIFTGFLGLLPASASRLLEGYYQMGRRMDRGSIV